MKTNDGGPAFPVECYANGEGIQTSAASRWETGMTLRDYFAAKALAALIGEPQWTGSKPLAPQLAPKIDDCAGTYAAAAYHLADAMLRARETTP